jgi:hypothetical protein
VSETKQCFVVQYCSSDFDGEKTWSDESGVRVQPFEFDSNDPGERALAKDAAMAYARFLIFQERKFMPDDDGRFLEYRVVLRTIQDEFIWPTS